MFKGYGRAFNGAGSWNFGNDYAKNVEILNVVIVHHVRLIITRIILLY